MSTASSVSSVYRYAIYWHKGSGAQIEGVVPLSYYRTLQGEDLDREFVETEIFAHLKRFFRFPAEQQDTQITVCVRLVQTSSATRGDANSC
jgi:hypothetical protein